MSGKGKVTWGKGGGKMCGMEGRVERTRLCGERQGGKCVEWRGRVERTRLCGERQGHRAER